MSNNQKLSFKDHPITIIVLGLGGLGGIATFIIWLTGKPNLPSFFPPTTTNNQESSLKTSQNSNFTLPKINNPKSTPPLQQPDTTQIPNTIPTIPSLKWEDKASEYRGRLDQDFTFNCPSGGTTNYPIWGTDIYTDDSSICTAAVHFGLITAKDGGQVTIKITPREESYEGTFRNGVQSKRYNSWEGSFIFVK